MRPKIQITFEGEAVNAREGDSVAAALWNAGERHLRSSLSGEPRGWLCAMGSCYECVMLIDGSPRRACLTPCADGMSVAHLDDADGGR